MKSLKQLLDERPAHRFPYPPTIRYFPRWN
jgi:hypothetical protein